MSAKKHKTTALLGLLVLANAALWAAYLRRAETPPLVPLTLTPTPAVPPSPVPAPSSALEVPKVWSQLQSDDPMKFATNLRATGVPEATVRLLVSGQLRERYLARQRELFGATDPAQLAGAPESRDRMAGLRALAREQQELLRSLFGPDENERAARERQRRVYGPLPDEKLDQLDGIMADYDEVAAEIREKSGGLLLPTEREALALLEQERRKDIAAILTPSELEQFDLQNSPAARALRNRLAGFAPTEAEFRKIFTLQRAFDEKFARRSGGGFEETKSAERTAAEQELETKLRSALGDGRFAEYRRQNDAGYRMALRIAERFGLPAQRAGEVYTLAQDAQVRLQVLRNDRTLTPEAALRSLTALDRETNEKLCSLLGAEGAEDYKETSGGAWLRTMDRVLRPAAVSVVSAAAATGAAMPTEASPPVPAASATIPAPADPSLPATAVGAPSSGL